MTLPAFAPDSTAAEARDRLVAAGWRLIGTGDWAWVYADPDDRIAARVTPFDPGYRLFAEDCLAGPPNRFLPRLHALAPLANSGYVIAMDCLWPAEPDKARAFCAAIGIASDSCYDMPAGQASDEAGMIALRERLTALLARGRARYRLWGGSDIREGNVMADSTGALKLVDPVFVAGRRIVDALQQQDANALADFTTAELEDFLTIPVWEGKPEDRRTFLAHIHRLRG